MSNREFVSPLESLELPYKILYLTGLSKPLNKQKNKFFHVFHQVYRCLVLMTLFLFCLQHVIYAVQMNGDTEAMAGALMIIFPVINNFPKLLTQFWNNSRLDNIRRVMEGPLFAAYSKEHEAILNTTTRGIKIVVRVIVISVSACGTFWFIAPLLTRRYDDTAGVAAWYPFSTESWTGLTIAAFIEMLILYLNGYGQLTWDCVITAYYAQARAQIKIVRHNLFNLIQRPHRPNGSVRNGVRLYEDYGNEDIKKEFVHIVQRYNKAMWLITEVESIFKGVMLLQLLISATSICIGVFKMTTVPIYSSEILYVVMYLLCCLVEIFLYCFVGTLLEYECSCINDSIYMSNWLSLSPQFRRHLLIAMPRWSRPVTPLAADVVPMNLPTFVTTLRVAYTMYTVLKRTT